VVMAQRKTKRRASIYAGQPLPRLKNAETACQPTNEQ
jgi:hypothetical protein